MRSLIVFLLVSLMFKAVSQSPCEQGTVLINGAPVDAVMLENDNHSGLKLPLWLKSGSTLAAGARVHLISVIEFEVINNQAQGNNLVFSQVLEIGSQVQTVPAGKTWKVESLVKHANVFASGFSASSNSPICQNQQLSLSVTPVSGATYQWTGPNNFTSTLQNPVISSATLAAGGTYTVTALLNGCTSNPVTTNIVVNTLPSADFTSNPSQVVTNVNATFNPSTLGNAYTWTFDSGIPSSSAAQSPIVQWTNSGNYDVTLNATDQNGCSATSTQVVSVLNCVPGQPQSSFSWTPPNPIAGQAAVFTPTGSGSSYDWTFGGGTPATSSSPSPSVSWSTPGNYSVSLTATSAGCSTTTELSVMIAAPSGSQNFAYTGSAQNFTVPVGVTNITIEAWGAQGGESGGLGGYAKGTYAVIPGALLNVFVGGQGVSSNGGFNGGGNGSYSGGGGASDVRTGINLTDRIIVAGGGGGSTAWGSSGGIGGGLNGGNATNSNSYSCSGPSTTVYGIGGGGGSQSSGGTAGSYSTTHPSWVGNNGHAGVLGIGGGADGWNNGGGGGGYYGGGSGGTPSCSGWGAGGGGGSSYTGTGTNTSNLGGVRTGNGQVIISW